MSQLSAEQTLRSGLQLHQSGKFAEAEALYRQVLARDPKQPSALELLGILLGQSGRLDEGIQLLRRALKISPRNPATHNNLGNLLKSAGHIDDAIASFRRALSHKPDDAMALSNLGVALAEKGLPNDAVTHFERALQINPAMHGIYSNLGNALKALGRTDDAIAAFHKVLAADPADVEAHSNLGNVFLDTACPDEAIACYRQAIRLNPNYADAHYNLANALLAKYQTDDAIASLREALRLKPDYIEALNNLGNTLKDLAQMEDALAAYRQALAIDPAFTKAHSNLVYAMHFHAGVDASELKKAHALWNHQHADPLKPTWPAHTNDRDPNRRLRIGYLSPDFRKHPVGQFMTPLLAAHDHIAFEIFCYADVPSPDDLTAKHRAAAHHWRSIVAMDDQQIASLIIKDKIDILIDLTMHMARNRMRLFARKPAPIQATYLAYCSTTGLDAIDYRLTDPCLDPVGIDESLYSEKTIRLPETYWCYAPLIETPAVNDLPALSTGHITFGCLNNFSKVSDPTLETWATLLHALPSSRLILHSHEGAHRQRVLDILERSAIASDRIEFFSRAPIPAYFQQYLRIDIALDPFPYAGGTTTCDALWMGVPVITRAGQTAVGRGGVSILTNLGLPELIAQTSENYIQIAVALAENLPRLMHLRSSLRERMRNSPLMDAPRFARGIESAYRRMWQNWCAQSQ